MLYSLSVNMVLFFVPGNVVWIKPLTAARAMLKLSISYRDIMGDKGLPDRDSRDRRRPGVFISI